MIRKIKCLLFYLLSAFSKPVRAIKHLEERREEAVQKVEVHLTDRSEYKAEFIREWVKPENVAARIKKLEEEAPAALARAKEMSKAIREQFGLPEEDPPLPPDDELPKHMRGQQASTIRAMLRQEGYEFCKVSQKFFHVKHHSVR